MKPKRLKPGQFCTINRVVYRAKKRSHGCNGCALDDFVRCPNIVDSRSGELAIECSLDNIILVRV